MGEGIGWATQSLHISGAARELDALLDRELDALRDDLRLRVRELDALRDGLRLRDPELELDDLRLRVPELDDFELLGDDLRLRDPELDVLRLRDPEQALSKRAETRTRKDPYPRNAQRTGSHRRTCRRPKSSRGNSQGHSDWK